MVETNLRKSVLLNLNSISPIYNDDDYIEITEWINEEGYDINIDTRGNKSTFSLHYDELKVLNFLTSYLDYLHYNKIKLVENGKG